MVGKKGNDERSNLEKHTSRNPLMRLALSKLHGDLDSIIKGIGAKNILDVGCGEGFTTGSIKGDNPGAKVVGMDIDRERLKEAKARFPGVDSFLQGSIYGIPLKKNSYDLVTAVEVLEHLERPEEAVDELARVSKRYVILSVPREPLSRLANMLRLKNLGSWGSAPGHIHSWSAGGFVSFIRKQLKLVAVRKSTFWTIVLCEKR